jgi:hypothetical protein
MSVLENAPEIARQLAAPSIAAVLAIIAEKSARHLSKKDLRPLRNITLTAALACAATLLTLKWFNFTTTTWAFGEIQSLSSIEFIETGEDNNTKRVTATEDGFLHISVGAYPNGTADLNVKVDNGSPHPENRAAVKVRGGALPLDGDSTTVPIRRGETWWLAITNSKAESGFSRIDVSWVPIVRSYTGSAPAP